MPSTILLDLDGTLTDPFIGISRCIVYALEQMDIPVPAEKKLHRWIGPPLKASFADYFAGFGGGDADLAVALYRERFGDVGLYENAVYDGVPELLESLNTAGYRLMLATAKPTVYAARIVGHFGLDRWLEEVHGSELDGRRTDKVELLAHIIDEHALESSACMMVGDREHDVRAARYHGMTAVGVLWGYGTGPELHEAGANHLLSSPAELMNLLQDMATNGHGH